MKYNDYSLSPKKLLRAFPTLPKSALSALPYALGILGFLGFLDATYLTILHYKNAIPPCTIHGCEVVLTSNFATIAGIPISLIGAGYYLVVLGLVGLLFNYSSSERSESRSSSRQATTSSHSLWQARTITTLLLLLTATGFLIGIFLVALQAFVLHAFCQYCLASEVIDFLLFDCAWWLWRRTAA